jgi:large conductance mechanosensitive channel
MQMEEMTLGVFDRAKDLGGRGFKTGSSTLDDFRKFILRGNVVDLAIAVVIGVAFNNVILGFVKDIITPLIPTPKGAAGLAFHVGYSGGTINLGDLINVIISFLVIALVVFFFVVKPMNAVQEGYNRLHPKAVAAPTTRECPYCLSTIPLGATRCAFCTAQLPPEPAQSVPMRQV